MQGNKRYGTDGAFTETKEIVGGYYVVECKDAADAEAVAMRIPVASNAWVQVRQLLLYDKESGATSVAGYGTRRSTVW